MIEAVIMFGCLTMLFEFVLLCMMSPRMRLRVLGSPSLSAAMHILFLIANVILHWGTLIGSMSAILAFVGSLITIKAARLAFGYVRGDIYQPGLVRYRAEELL